MSKMLLRTSLVGAGVAALATAAHAQDLNPPVSPATIGTATTTGSVDTSATDSVPEIVVTAEHRAQNVQKAASSVSVRTGPALQAEGRYQLSQILEDVPGVVGGAAANTSGSLGSGTDNPAAGITIRGIQSNQGTGGSVTSVSSAAATYVDGVYQGIGSTYDIDRVEVLRGPQGTLYGRSATAGLIAIHTFDPNLKRPGADVLVEAGNYDLQHYSGAVNLPIIEDKLGLRVSGNRFSRDGYYNGKGGAFRNTDGRAKLLFKPSDDFSLLLGFALQDNKTHTGGTAIILATPNEYSRVPVPVGLGKNRFRQYWAEVNWDLGFATLTYEPTYKTWQSHAQVYADLGGLLLTQQISVPKDHFHTEELRLASDPGSRLSWQLGALYYNNDLSNSNAAAINGLFAFSSDTRSKSTKEIGVFGEATYAASDSLRLTGGVRYDYTKIAIDQSYTSFTGQTQILNGDAGERTFNNFTYRARVEDDLTDRNLLYASVSTGFSPGDETIGTSIGGNPVVLELKAETLTAYEIGSKNRFLDNALQVNGALFYYHYSGYQTGAINVNPTNPNGGFAVLSSPARSYGGELEILYKLTPNDRIGLNLGYTRAYFSHRNDVQFATGASPPFPPYVTFGQYFAEKEIPTIVPFTANLNYDHTVHFAGGSTLLLHGDVRYLSAYNGAPQTPEQEAAGSYPFIRVHDQVIGDLNLTWTSSRGNLSLTGYLRNVGDNRYKTFPPGVGGVVGPPLNVTTQPYDPRTYGVVLTVHI